MSGREEDGRAEGTRVGTLVDCGTRARARVARERGVFGSMSRLCVRSSSFSATFVEYYLRGNEDVEERRENEREPGGERRRLGKVTRLGTCSGCGVGKRLSHATLVMLQVPAGLPRQLGH